MTIKVKEWKANQIDAEAKKYHMWCDVVYVDGCAHDSEGNETYFVREVLGETEKAIRVILETGLVDGSTKGFTTWIPKSAIIEMK